MYCEKYHKDVMRFKKKEKLTPQYIGLFEILDRICAIAYRLALLPLSRIHNVFYESILEIYAQPNPCAKSVICVNLARYDFY